MTGIPGPGNCQEEGGEERDALMERREKEENWISVKRKDERRRGKEEDEKGTEKNDGEGKRWKGIRKSGGKTWEREGKGLKYKEKKNVLQGEKREEKDRKRVKKKDAVRVEN